MSYGYVEKWDRTVNVGSKSVEYRIGQRIRVYTPGADFNHREEFEIVAIRHANGELRLKRLPPTNHTNDK